MTRPLALVPARGGSKTIPKKNIAPVGGQPLIGWTLATALSAPGLDRVVVSTDDPEIADVARAWGAEAPFLRPAAISQDDTPGMAPVLHAIQWLDEHEDYRPDYLMLLQPTSPLRTVADITAALHLAQKRDADAVLSVVQPKHHPYWMKGVDAAGRLQDLGFYPPVNRRQDLPPVLAINGAIYLARCTVLLERETWYTEKTYAYVMPPERSLDIDTPWDLYLADLALKERSMP